MGEQFLLVEGARRHSKERLQLQIREGESLTVGRNCVDSDDRTLSREHFLVEFEEGLIHVTPLSSTSPTVYSNHPQKKLRENVFHARRELEVGDYIFAGQYRFEFQLENRVPDSGDPLPDQEANDFASPMPDNEWLADPAAQQERPPRPVVEEPAVSPEYTHPQSLGTGASALPPPPVDRTSAGELSQPAEEGSVGEARLEYGQLAFHQSIEHLRLSSATDLTDKNNSPTADGETTPGQSPDELAVDAGDSVKNKPADDDIDSGKPVEEEEELLFFMDVDSRRNESEVAPVETENDANHPSPEKKGSAEGEDELDFILNSDPFAQAWEGKPDDGPAREDPLASEQLQSDQQASEGDSESGSDIVKTEHLFNDSDFE